MFDRNVFLVDTQVYIELDTLKYIYNGEVYQHHLFKCVKNFCLELPYSWRKSIKFFFENDIFESVKIERGKLDRLCQYTLYCCYLSIDIHLLTTIFLFTFWKMDFSYYCRYCCRPSFALMKVTNAYKHAITTKCCRSFWNYVLGMYYAGIKVSLT